MPTKDELRRYADWALERIRKDEDPRDFWAFVKYLQATGGDVGRLADYGWPNSVIIAAPPTLPKELPVKPA